MRRKLLFKLFAHYLLIYQTQAKALLNSSPDISLYPTQFTLISPQWTQKNILYNYQAQNILAKEKQYIDQTDKTYRGYIHTTQNSHQTQADGGITDICGDLKGFLPDILVIDNCDEDISVPLQAMIQLNCPGAKIIITGGLDHTIWFDQSSGSLVFRANPRPSESTIYFMAVRQKDNKDQKLTLHFVRQSSKRKRGRRLCNLCDTLLGFPW